MLPGAGNLMQQGHMERACVPWGTILHQI